MTSSTQVEPKFRCTVCGRTGTVGRCCGKETREPLNDVARQETTERTCPQNPCVACKAALTPSEVAEIRAIAKELKRISGCMFGAKNMLQGYNLRNLHQRLDAVLFGREA